MYQGVLCRVYSKTEEDFLVLIIFFRNKTCFSLAYHSDVKLTFNCKSMNINDPFNFTYYWNCYYSADLNYTVWWDSKLAYVGSYTMFRRFINVHEAFIMWASRGSLESRNIMLAYNFFLFFLWGGGGGGGINYDLGQKLYAPKVQPDWDSNSCPSDHDRTFHVTETPALTTWLSVTSRIPDVTLAKLNPSEHQTQHKKASNHHANLPLEMYSFTS